ncbi:MAG: FMN-binding protein [Minisyncoccia bacterium]
MTTPKLIAFVRGQLAAGVPAAALRQTLIANGWTENDISEVFSVVAGGTPAKTAADVRPAQRTALPGGKIALSAGTIVVSIGYALWVNLGGVQSVTSAPASLPSQDLQTPITISTVAPSPSAPSPASANTAQIATAPKSPPSAKATAPARTIPVATETAPAAPAPAPAAPPKPAGAYADGSYTGTAENAYYGTVQVKAVISGGKISDVQFLQYPNDRSNSRFINGRAMPLLTQEAISAQNANVDGVSGATFTSQAFQQSLASALALAKN